MAASSANNVHRRRLQLRAKRLGLLIRDARMAAGRSLKETAEALRISPRTLRAYEEGRKSPSLPELAALAYYFQIPLEHFWGREIISDDIPPILKLPLEDLLAAHQTHIAQKLREARERAGYSLKDLAAATGISASRLAAYEKGERAAPAVELELIAEVLGLKLRDLLPKDDPLGLWLHQQQQIRGFLELPPELREFVAHPTHVPYLEVARKLSQMPVERLRTVAEVLLDITF